MLFRGTDGKLIISCASKTLKRTIATELIILGLLI